VYRILVVDDEPDFRDTLVGLLADKGYVVLPASNEGEALAAITQQPFDFALIDVRLHGADEEDESGLSLAMAIRALKPQVRVILLTRYVRTRQIVRAVRYHGVVDFIEKTPDVGQHVLNTIVESEAERGRPREQEGETTWLSIFLAKDRPLMARARGKHVSSTCTNRLLDVDLDYLAQKTEMARTDRKNFRFQINEIGALLWDSFFEEHPEIGRIYLEANAKSQSLSILFEASRRYLRLPLEFTRSARPAEYLVLQHPLARFVCDSSPRRLALSPQMLAFTEELRILVIASNTWNQKLRPIPGADLEAKQLYGYLMSQAQECIPISAQFVSTEQATYSRVREELRTRNYDIIHYAGHGSYSAESPEESSLYFWGGEKKSGSVVPMTGAELKHLLAQSEARLVYLSSCCGASTGDDRSLLTDDFLGLADAAVQAGIPSVMGFRWPVSDFRARKLAIAFYSSLLQQGSPEIALWSARCELAAESRNEPTWLSPILIHQK